MGVKPNIRKFENAVAFEKFVKEKLSASDYEGLPKVLGTNGTWFTRLMDNPSLMKFRQVHLLARELEIQPWVLMKRFGVGAFKMNAMEAMSFHDQWELANFPKLAEGDPTAGNQPVEVEVKTA